MDFKQFIPDFGAIAKTEWSKPQWGGKADIVKLIGIIAVAAMLTFVLCPWFGLDYSDEILNNAIMRHKVLPDLPTRAGITTCVVFLVSLQLELLSLVSFLTTRLLLFGHQRCASSLVSVVSLFIQILTFLVL